MNCFYLLWCYLFDMFCGRLFLESFSWFIYFLSISHCQCMGPLPFVVFQWAWKYFVRLKRKYVKVKYFWNLSTPIYSLLVLSADSVKATFFCLCFKTFLIIAVFLFINININVSKLFWLNYFSHVDCHIASGFSGNPASSLGKSFTLQRCDDWRSNLLHLIIPPPSSLCPHSHPCCLPWCTTVHIQECTPKC